MPKYDLENGAVVAGKYRITGTLGQGGMGSVYEAVNDAVGKRVALKLLNANLADHPEFAKRFELEARAAALIDHPGIVDVLDMGLAENGCPYMVMEHLQGVTLRALQRKLGPMAPGQASALVGPVLDALAAAHAAGVIHRDLKPANIFLAVRPTAGVKVLDFGISKFTGSGAQMTQTGTTMGTPAFMAPEQLRDGKNVGPHSDLYAVGAVLYSLLTGRPPYEADSDFALVAQVLTTEHKPLQVARPDVPPALASLVDQLLSKDPAKRPATARAAQQQLLKVAAPDARSVFAAALELTPRPRTTSAPETPTHQTPGPSRPGQATPGPTREAKPTRASRPVPLVEPPATPAAAPPVALAHDTPKETPAVRTGRAQPSLPLLAAIGVGLAAAGGLASYLLMRSAPDTPGRVNPGLAAQLQPLEALPSGTRQVAVQPPAQPTAAVDAGVTEPAPVVVAVAAAVEPAAKPGKPEKGKPGGKGKNAKVIVVGDAPTGPMSSPIAALTASEPAAGGGGAAEKYGKQMEEARALRNKGKNKDAMSMLDDAVRDAERAGDARSLGYALRNRGNLYDDAGKCTEAVDFFMRSIKSFETLNDPGAIGLVANDIGMLGLKCPGIDRVTWFKMAVEKRWKVRDLAGVRKSANNLGVAYLHKGDFENADHAYNDALMAATELKDLPGVMKVRSNMAFVWALSAAGNINSDNVEQMHIDTRSVEWGKAKLNYDQSIAAAHKAGLPDRMVCDTWVEYRKLCEKLDD